MSGTDARCCPSPSAAYKDFLTLWKDADSEIPIYKQAKAETRSWIRAKELRMKPLHRKFLQPAEFSNYNLSNLKPKKLYALANPALRAMQKWVKGSCGNNRLEADDATR